MTETKFDFGPVQVFHERTCVVNQDGSPLDGTIRHGLYFKLQAGGHMIVKGFGLEPVWLQYENEVMK